MPNPQHLNFKDLQELTGYQRPADVERCLKKQGVPFFIGKDGPFTVDGALQQALGIRQDAKPQPQALEFDF